MNGTYSALLSSVVLLGLIVGCGEKPPEKPASNRTAVAPVSHDLDGRTFAVQLVKEGKPDDPDNLIFDKGTFDSTACRKYGYVKTAYTIKKEGETTTFKASSTSEEYGVNYWTGTIKGDAITGKMVWDNGKKKVNYTYTGKLKSK